MKKIILLFALFFTGTIVTQAQTDYRFHSIFIYNFTKYIQWPAQQQTGDFVIGVLGNATNVVEELSKITANKTVGSQKIVVKKFKSAAEASACHILFIPSSGSHNFDDAQNILKGKPTLVITEKSGLAQKGSGINFILQDNKWKFELNEAATQSSGLKVSRELAQMAISV